MHASYLRAQREGWLSADPEDVAAKYRSGELDQLDVVRQFGVILDWGTGELLEKSTGQFREMMDRRSLQFWRDGLPVGARR